MARDGLAKLVTKKWISDDVKDPDVLDDKIMEEITRYNFSTERIEYWLNKGLNIDAKNSEGNTLLMKAVLRNDKEVIQWLINNKADVNAQNNNGTTALSTAVVVTNENANFEGVIDLLIKNKADVDAKDNNGQTALMYADHEVIKALFRNKEFA